MHYAGQDGVQPALCMREQRKCKQKSANREERRYMRVDLIVSLVLLAGVNLDTRIACILVSEHGASSSETLRILVEEDVALVLDELALLEHAVDLGPASGAAAEVDAVLGKALTERIGRLPSVVVGDLARDVVENVRLRDAVRCKGTEPAHHAAEVTEEVAVEGSERSTGESELRSTVVGQDRVGVLEESNEDEPVVHPGVPTSEPSV